VIRVAMLKIVQEYVALMPKNARKYAISKDAQCLAALRNVPRYVMIKTVQQPAPMAQRSALSYAMQRIAPYPAMLRTMIRFAITVIVP
jgi:hypothetical protein